MDRSNSNLGAGAAGALEERRAKSSMGENSATRLRTKVVGAQKIQ